ncbi:MAG: glutathione binding-like protein, partial [Rhodovibrionaceae bacterium]
AVSRYIRLHLPEGHERYGELPKLAEKGHAALKVMEGHLEKRTFFAGGAYSIADIALYAYTHVADEGGYDLAPYPAVRAWLDRVAGQPQHIPITRS